MPTLQELLDDAAIQDDLEINFGEKGKFKVGDLRGVRKANRDKVEAELRATKAKNDELDRLATEATKLLEKIGKEGGGEPAKAGASEDINFETDPIYAPLYTKKLKPLESKLTEVLSSIEKLSKSFNDSAAFVMSDYYERRWNTIPETDRPKDKTWRDYLKVANDKGYLNEYKLPDPVEAFNRERAPIVANTLEKELAALRTKNEELTKQLEQAPRMPRPGAQGTGGPTPSGAKGDKVYTDVGNMIDDAFADPTIQNIIAGVHAGNA